MSSLLTNRGSERASLLDPYNAYLKDRVQAEHPNWIPATVLMREIQYQGFTGSYSIHKKYMAGFRPPKVVEADNRFETAPGKQLHVDFTTIRRGRGPVKALVATMGYSRSSFVRFYRRER